MRRLTSGLFLLLAMGLAVFALDRLVADSYGEQTLAPLLSVLCFAVLIFIGSPALVLLAIPVFALESYFLIEAHSMYPHIRTLTVVLGGLLAWWACWQRKDLERRLEELDLILEKIAVPWILCDRSGNMLRLSTSAAVLTMEPQESLAGISFFSKFSAGPSKGELIQKFLKAADSRTLVENYSVVLTRNPAQIFLTSLVPIRAREGFGILVIFSSTPSKVNPVFQ